MKMINRIVASVPMISSNVGHELSRYSVTKSSTAGKKIVIIWMRGVGSILSQMPVAMVAINTSNSVIVMAIAAPENPNTEIKVKLSIMLASNPIKLIHKSSFSAFCAMKVMTKIGVTMENEKATENHWRVKTEERGPEL